MKTYSEDRFLILGLLWMIMAQVADTLFLEVVATVAGIASLAAWMVPDWISSFRAWRKNRAAR